MPDFTDMVAQAVSPAMSREEREAIYDVVRRALLRLQDAEGTPDDDPGLLFQQHLVEDTIRDVEAEITRYLALRRLAAGEDEGGEAGEGVGQGTGEETGEGTGEGTGGPAPGAG